MPNYTIAEEPLNFEYLKKLYDNTKRRYYNFSYADLNCIFNIACHNPNLFPSIHIQEIWDCDSSVYMEKWVDRYFYFMMNLPHERKFNPCNEGLLEIIATSQDFSEPKTTPEESVNNPLSSQNIHKTLLQLFIARKIRPYGFIWCAGNVLEGIDFCNTNGSFFLKIKNKSDIENSSNTNFSHPTNIKKGPAIGTWCRLTEYHDDNWPLLNSLINRHLTDGFNRGELAISEESYQQFLINITYQNYELIKLINLQ